MKLAGWIWMAAAAGAQDWDSLARQAAAIDRETLRLRPVITPFCGQGDWSGQYIGYRDAAGTGWRKIRLLSDGQPYSSGIVDIYPPLGYQREIKENAVEVAGGSRWEETRTLFAAGSTRAQRREAAQKRLLPHQPWQPQPGDPHDWRPEALERLAWAAERIVLREISPDGTSVTVAPPEGSPESCDLAMAPAFLPVLRRHHADWSAKPVRLRIELRMVRLGRWEGVLTGVEPDRR